MTDQHPLVERYLARLDEGLRDLAPADRREVVRDIRSHIAESVAAGKPLDAVLESLGSADVLARAYAVELLLHPRATPAKGAPRADRWLKIAGLIAIGSLPTFIIVVVLTAFGVAFTASGIAVFVAGVLASSGALPYWVQMDVPPVVAIALGPILAAVGILSAMALFFYMRFVARTVRAVLPKAS